VAREVSWTSTSDAPPFAERVRVLVSGSMPRTFTAQEAAASADD